MKLVHSDQGNSIIGVWFSNLPENENEIKSPYVWAACSRLIICEDNFKARIKSPSTDRNTFLVCTYNESRSKQINAYEFKVIQNVSDKKETAKQSRSYNSWVFYHSIVDVTKHQKAGEPYQIKMNILKQPVEKPMNLKVYKFSKLIKEYDFGLPMTNLRKPKGSSSCRERSYSSKRKKSSKKNVSIKIS